MASHRRSCRRSALCGFRGGRRIMAATSSVFVLFVLASMLIVVDAYSVSQSGANNGRPEKQQQQQPQQTINNGIKVGGCQADRLVVYKVVLHTYWTRDLFPKHYPDWRPVAQWTKSVGELCVVYVDPGMRDRRKCWTICYFWWRQKQSCFLDTIASVVLTMKRNPLPNIHRV